MTAAFPTWALALSLLATATGCVLNDPEPPQTHEISKETDTTTPTPASDDATPAAVQPPPDWTGTGVLARAERLPAGAPDWSAVRAEVRTDGAARYLYASACVTRIENRALATAAAQNRARAELARWLGTERLVGSEITSDWHGPTQAACSQARIEVPAQWQPGEPVPPTTP